MCLVSCEMHPGILGWIQKKCNMRDAYGRQCFKYTFCFIGITEEERQFLAPPMLKFTRSLSMPDTSEDIPPPPQSLPPSPPPPSPSLYNSPKSPTSRSYGTIKPPFNQNSGSKISLVRPENVGTMIRDKGIYYRRELDRYSLDSEDLYSRSAAS